MDPLGPVLAQYKQAAIAHGEATAQGNYRAGNHQYEQLSRHYLTLRRAGSEGLAHLLPLLADQNPSVACWAATHLLPYEEQQALDTLTRIATQTGIIAFNAEMTLQAWQSGRLQPDDSTD
ncbi:DUF2019 domain-containing protein [Hymenobacter crusticola]|uniref:Uncharacterized protein n=1 Tax=Hymenobacter crusticola TaxID=1770526 RepID=A0A243W5Q8_9BACT|nr:DUF2019 domain-containing protein [Hymenobacter crusticola]OUJ68584.1 hypothetical protein BXP70_27880 [Hymenobacter crusticola]